MGCTRPSQRLKSPTTLTRSALGAHTAKRVPSTPSRRSTWLPSTFQPCRSRPSLSRYRSCPLMTGAKAYGSCISCTRPSSSTPSRQGPSGRWRPVHSNRPAACNRCRGESPVARCNHTSSAWGRNTRRRQPSPARCSPSSAKGSCSRAASSWSISGSGTRRESGAVAIDGRVTGSARLRRRPSRWRRLCAERYYRLATVQFPLIQGVGRAARGSRAP